MSDQEKMKELISRYVEGEVTEEERHEVETLLKDSREMKEYHDELQRLSQVLGRHPQEQSSPDWERKVQNALQSPESANRRSPLKRVSSSWLEVGVVAMLFIGCLLSLQVYIKRGIQGRLKSASDDIGDQYSTGNTNIRSITNVYGNEVRKEP